MEATIEEDEDVEKHWKNLKTYINTTIENTVGFKLTSVSKKTPAECMLEWEDEFKS